jgi:hypothetical protein
MDTLLPTQYVGSGSNKPRVKDKIGDPYAPNIVLNTLQLCFDYLPYYRIKNGKHDFIRIGDYLKVKQVARICNYFIGKHLGNLPSILLICCHHIYNKFRAKNDIVVESTKFDGDQSIVDVVDIVNSIGIDMDAVMSNVGGLALDKLLFQSQTSSK